MKQHLYVGIDISKQSHSCAFLVNSLPKQCPVKRINNNRAGFDALLAAIKQHVNRTRLCSVLLEHTGHYGVALEQFLLESGVTVYRMQAKKRYGRNKTDDLDAQKLAKMLYAQIELQAPVPDEQNMIYPLKKPQAVASKLRALVRHRHELARELVRRENKLHAIMDEIFPEFTEVYKNPNLKSALLMREKFPTPAAIADASIDELCAARMHRHPSRANLLKLQELARTSIGTKDEHRCAGLLIEQKQHTDALTLMNTQIEQLDSVIAETIADSREGQILTSFTGIGPTQAAILLAGIGTIANFESAARLKGYLGWTPQQSQTGTSKDTVKLSPGGNQLLKATMCLVAMAAVRHDPHWRAMYERLLKRKCRYDARKDEYIGKMKCIGHVAGQMIKVIYRLLKVDYDLQQSWTGEPEEMPEPELYDPAKYPLGGSNHRSTPATSGMRAAG